MSADIIIILVILGFMEAIAIIGYNGIQGKNFEYGSKRL